MRFSERHGFKSVRETIQIESISDALRNSLWSLLELQVWTNMVSAGTFGGVMLRNNPPIRALCKVLWFYHFQRPVDTIDDDWRATHKFLRAYFFAAEWYEVYDFVEFVANNFPYQNSKATFLAACNATFEREVSAYRFLDGIICPIADNTELAEVELALGKQQTYVQTHLRRALQLLSDRELPDYRNSIKESISAVESMVAIVLGEKGTLGQLLKKLDSEMGVHSALQKAFANLYGYTSDENGIRHAIMGSESITFEDAKFFLVVCSAFVNFVASKLAKK